MCSKNRLTVGPMELVILSFRQTDNCSAKLFHASTFLKHGKTGSHCLGGWSFFWCCLFCFFSSPDFFHGNCLSSWLYMELLLWVRTELFGSIDIVHTGLFSLVTPCGDSWRRILSLKHVPKRCMSFRIMCIIPKPIFQGILIIQEQDYCIACWPK